VEKTKDRTIQEERQDVRTLKRYISKDTGLRRNAVEEKNKLKERHEGKKHRGDKKQGKQVRMLTVKTRCY
jgi:hypothetical protein